MKLGFVITNDKASYVTKEDSIFLFSIAKESKGSPLMMKNQKNCPIVDFDSLKDAS